MLVNEEGKLSSVYERLHLALVEYLHFFLQFIGVRREHLHGKLVQQGFRLSRRADFFIEIQPSNVTVFSIDVLQTEELLVIRRDLRLFTYSVKQISSLHCLIKCSAELRGVEEHNLTF